MSKAIPVEVIDFKYAVKIDDFDKDKWISAIDSFQKAPLKLTDRQVAVDGIKRKGLDLSEEVRKLAQLYKCALSKK